MRLSLATICVALSMLVCLAAASIDAAYAHGNQALPAGASQIVSNGVESPRVLLDNSDRGTRNSKNDIGLFRKLSSKSLSVAPVGSASDSAKALAHGSLNVLADLTYGNNVVGHLLRKNGSAAPNHRRGDYHDAQENGSTMSPGRRKLAGVGLALLAVTLFFAIYM